MSVVKMISWIKFQNHILPFLIIYNTKWLGITYDPFYNKVVSFLLLMFRIGITTIIMQGFLSFWHNNFVRNQMASQSRGCHFRCKDNFILFTNRLFRFIRMSWCLSIEMSLYSQMKAFSVSWMWSSTWCRYNWWEILNI